MVRLSKITLIISILMLTGLVGAVYSYYNTNHNKKQVSSQESTSSSGSSIGIDVSPNNQTIKLYSEPSQTSNQSSPSSQTSNPSYPGYSQPTYHDANLGQYLPPTYSSTPMPSFDYGRPSPTLQTPPPQCVKQIDSSYPC